MGAVIHWFENAGQDVDGVYNWFEGRKSGLYDFGGCHAGLGLHGQVQYWIPWNERTYHVGGEWYNPEAVKLFGYQPNMSTVGVEWAHPDWTGKPTDATYKSGIIVYARICTENDLDPMTRIVTHSFITGKRTERGSCHKWFYEHPMELQAFRGYVLDAMSGRMP
jgi:hypothetical protein